MNNFSDTESIRDSSLLSSLSTEAAVCLSGVHPSSARASQGRDTVGCVAAVLVLTDPHYPPTCLQGPPDAYFIAREGGFRGYALLLTDV